MFNNDLLANFFLVIAAFIIGLSLTGTTLGIRLVCAKILLVIFEWVSNLQAEELDLDDDECEFEVELNATPDRPPITQPKTSTVRKKRISGDRPLITRQWSSQVDRKLHASDVDTESECESMVGDTIIPAQIHTFDVLINDSMEFVSAGMESIIQDEVTSRFKAAQLPSWNLLSRSRSLIDVFSWKLNFIWFIGLIFRYSVLLPLRFFVFCVGLIVLCVCSLVIGAVPFESVRITLNRYAMQMFFRIMSRACASLIVFHDTENRPKNGIVVSNHTSPVDVMVLSCDNCYSLIGQSHGGVLGMIQKAVSRCSHHIWFERTQSKDRSLVRKALQDHIEDQSKMPILIFPEGTCINNTSVMLFKKGSFEVSDVVHPIAMRYDNRLGDPFWNSSQEGYFSYLVGLMTSWALMCEVWYLPPVKREPGEDSIDFARRVKRMIAQKGGLADLEWDGNLKRSLVPDKLKVAQKNLFFEHFKRTISIPDLAKFDTSEFDQLGQEENDNTKEGIQLCQGGLEVVHRRKSITGYPE